jgi:hypothetical protein
LDFGEMMAKLGMDHASADEHMLSLSDLSQIRKAMGSSNQTAAIAGGGGIAARSWDSWHFRGREAVQDPKAQVELGAHRRPKRFFRLYSRHSDVAMPIASITKLMTAIGGSGRRQPLDEPIRITKDEPICRSAIFAAQRRHRADPRRSHASGADVLREPCGPHLGGNYPGGLPAMVSAMNAKAAALGMTNCALRRSDRPVQ